MSQFELKDYVDEIRAIQKNAGCTITAAVDRFILNLNTFNEYNKGTGTINFHQLGQFWCNLTSGEKIAQKKALKQQLLDEAENYGRKSRRR